MKKYATRRFTFFEVISTKSRSVVLVLAIFLTVYLSLDFDRSTKKLVNNDETQKYIENVHADTFDLKNIAYVENVEIDDSLDASRLSFKESQSDESMLPNEDKLGNTMKLTGVIYNNGMNDSLAIIADEHKEAQYAINAKLPNGYELVEIHRYHVLIRHQERIEYLKISPKGSSFNKDQIQNDSRYENAELTNEDNSKIELARAWTGQLVSSISENISAPMMTDEMFDISSHVNLNEGDIITSINAIRLEGPISVQMIIDSVKLSHFIEVELLRNNEKHKYLIEMF